MSLDYTRNYSGSEVQKIVAILIEEFSKSIEASYQEGYRAAMLLYAPDVAFYKTKAEGFERELKHQTSRAFVPWWSIPICIIGGTALGYGLSFIRN